MSYIEYQKMMGFVSDNYEEKLKENNITTKNYNWKEPNQEGYGTVYLKDGIPFLIQWYIWDISTEKVLENISNDLNMKLEMFNFSGGNGHCQAELRVI